MLIVASAELERFIQSIVDDHGLATGIKSLGTHYDIVAYANIRGYSVSLSEWGRYVAMDTLQASDLEITLMQQADPAHWSWAFRQLSRWRSLLMEGTDHEGLLGAADFMDSVQASMADAPKPSPAVPLSNDQKDVALQAFIALVRSQPELRDQVKGARNQDDVIALAEQQGFFIDSLTLLRSWSQVSDFSKPTWFGWFDE
ncbi:Nif11-like leader peptide family natural product precursor [Synechococcus sp. A10-1-5-9]|uniref:Nif11-like leader peptide family natural product precursor n=1 Tax=Synechococcus sp. A10-1-5-9 TaxID=3392295 RepID=UPI0039ECCCD2